MKFLLFLLMIPSLCFADSELTIGGKTAQAHIIQSNGTSLTPRPYLNFVGLSCSDTGGKTVCTISVNPTGSSTSGQVLWNNAGVVDGFGDWNQSSLMLSVVRLQTGLIGAAFLNSVDIGAYAGDNGSMAIGTDFAGIHLLASDGLGVENFVTIGTPSGLNSIDVGAYDFGGGTFIRNASVVIGKGYAGIVTAPDDSLLVQKKVGIGVISPSEALDIVGNEKIGIPITPFSENPNINDFNLSNTPVQTNTVTGIYFDANTSSNQTFHDNGAQALISDYDSHQVGQIDYGSGYVYTWDWVGENIVTISYYKLGVGGNLYLSGNIYGNTVSMGPSVFSGGATSSGVLMNQGGIKKGMSQEDQDMAVFINDEDYSGAITPSLPGVIFQLDSRNAYGMFKVYRREATSRALTAPLSITDLQNVNIGGGGGLRENNNQALFWGVPLTGSYPLLRLDNTSSVQQIGVSYTGDLTLTGGITVGDGKNFVVGSSTGTKFGTSTSQLMAFYNSTPITQPANNIEIGAVLSNLGLRSAGQTYPIPTSGLSRLTGGFALGYVAKTSNYTASASNYVIDCTANTFTVTLPTAAGIQGQIYIIKNSGTGVITIATTSSQTIDGTTTKVLNSQYQSYTVMSNGSNWIIT